MAESDIVNPFEAPRPVEIVRPPTPPSRLQTGVILCICAMIGAGTAPLTLLAEYFPRYFTKPLTPFTLLGTHAILLTVPAVWFARRCESLTSVKLTMAANLISWGIYIPLVHALSGYQLVGREFLLVAGIGCGSLIVGLIAAGVARASRGKMEHRNDTVIHG